MVWGTISILSVASIGAMLVSARLHVFPRSMVVRDAAKVARSRQFSRIVNVGMPASVLLAVLTVARNEPAAIAVMLALFAAVDLGYYTWTALNNE